MLLRWQQRRRLRQTVAGKIDLLIDVTLRHDFIGAGRSGHNQGRLRPYQRNRQVAFLPACISTSRRIHDELLHLLFLLSHKQADNYFAALGYEAHKEEFCHRRGVFFHRNRCTIGMACAQAVALRGAPTLARRNVPVPRRAGGG